MTILDNGLRTVSAFCYSKITQGHSINDMVVVQIYGIPKIVVFLIMFSGKFQPTMWLDKLIMFEPKNPYVGIQNSFFGPKFASLMRFN